MTSKMLPVDTFSPEDLARLAHLRYVVDEEPGFTRHCNGNGFSYTNGSRVRLRARGHLDRIDSLAVPPAWTDVWICKFADGHLQATGHDARGRKQYIYHERWREISNLAKFLRLKPCPRFLPALRRKIARDLHGRKLTRDRVLAGMVALLDLTSIRVGSEEYARENDSYGLATLRNRHVQFERARAIIRFRAKAGLRREVIVENKQLVRLLKQLKPLPGAHIFQYLDDAGVVHTIDSTAVNDYLRDRTGHPFTAKDFRTWKASSIAAGILHDERDVEKLAARKRIAKAAIWSVSEALGNTPTVCRTYYVHAALVDAYLNGSLMQILGRFSPLRKNSFTREEQLLARFLRRWSG